MFKLNLISKTVKLTLLSSLISVPAFMAQAENNETKEERKVVITGSRLSQSDMETALPVTVISAEEIKATGLQDVGSVIAQMPFNSQGSFVSSSGSSATNHSSSGLRGLGSNRTLTLIDGKRIAPSSTFGGESTNLNLIPIQAVERIDILRDGAGAIYGSDAIGGVINVILKSDYEGLMLSATAGRPSGDTGDEDGFTLTVGTQADKGSSLFIFEHKEWEGVQYGTRDPVLNADWDIPYNRSSLYAPEGNYHPVGADGKQNGPWVAGNCAADRVIDLGSKGKRCGYSYLDGKNHMPGRVKDSVFTNFLYNINNEFSWKTQFMALRDTTNTASTSVWTPGGTRMAADNPYNPTFGSANPVEIQAYTRLVGVADRETEFDTNVYNIDSSLIWETDHGVLETSITASRNDANVKVEHYIFRDKYDKAVQDGLYNPFVQGGNATEETLNSFLHTSTRKAETRTKGVSSTWSAETALQLQGGNMEYAVGGEWQDYYFKDELDRQSAPGGSAFPTFGGNSGGDREYYAVYGELNLPILDNLSVKVASRYDKYSLPDEGKVSSSVNIRYEVLDDLLLRASYSQGFRVPSIDDLLSEEALSFNRVTDPIFCATLPPADQAQNDWCTDGVQIERRSEGNKDLKPETSDQYAFGVVWDITDDISLTADYYDIQINDQVQFLEAQDVVFLEHAGMLNAFDPTKINVTRDTTGNITNIQTGSINQAGTSTDGIDLGFKAKIETDEIGSFYFDFNGSYILSYETQATPLAPRLDEVGSQTTPEHRFNTSFGYRINDFTSKLTYRYITDYDGTTVVEEMAGVDVDRIEKWEIVDLNLGYDFERFGNISFGVRNLTDKLPKLNTTFRYGYDKNNQSVLGRVLYATYTISF